MIMILGRLDRVTDQVRNLIGERDLRLGRVQIIFQHVGRIYATETIRSLGTIRLMDRRLYNFNSYRSKLMIAVLGLSSKNRSEKHIPLAVRVRSRRFLFLLWHRVGNLLSARNALARSTFLINRTSCFYRARLCFNFSRIVGAAPGLSRIGSYDSRGVVLRCLVVILLGRALGGGATVGTTC